MSDDIRFKDLSDSQKRHDQLMQLLEEIERKVDETTRRTLLILALTTGPLTGIFIGLAFLLIRALIHRV